MQKHLILGVCCSLFIFLSTVQAAVVSLPRYTGDLSGRENTGGRDKTNLSCSQKGMYAKPTDPCKVCQGAVGDCCSSISCSTTSGCYQYSAADANKYTCSESCTDGNGTHYKSCTRTLTCGDVNGLTTEEANPYISAGFSCSQTRTTCTIMGTSLGPCIQSSVVSGGSLTGGVSGGSLTGGVSGGISTGVNKQSVICYTCICPDGMSSTGGSGCSLALNVGEIACYQCECPDGTYSSEGSCIPCPEGLYGSGGICTPCSAGTYSDTTGATKCTPCPAGYSSKNVTGATSLEDACTPCPTGTYKTTSGSGSCFPCPADYNPISGVTGATSLEEACVKPCVGCSTATYPLLTCPSHAVCEECTPKNCEDNTTRYKISYCENGYTLSGNSCILGKCGSGTVGYKESYCPISPIDDCVALGYTSTGNCEKITIKCPFDNSKVFCM